MMYPLSLETLVKALTLSQTSDVETGDDVYGMCYTFNLFQLPRATVLPIVHHQEYKSNPCARGFTNEAVCSMCRNRLIH